MKSFRFLHFSDLHLDMSFGSIGSVNEKKSIRKRDLLVVFDSIINIAVDNKVHAILISGDMYEHRYIKKSTMDYINRRFSEIPDIKIFMVPGNHDPYIPNSYYKNYIWSKNVFVLSEDNPIVKLEDLKVCVQGIGFGSFYQDKTFLVNLESVNRAYFNILLFHGTVDMNFKKNLYNPATSEQLAQLNMDYIALGHFHNRIDNLGGKNVIYNPGSPEPLGFDEEGEHGVYLGKIEWNAGYPKTLETSFIKTGKKVYKTLEIKTDGFYEDNQIIEKIMDETGLLYGENSLIRIILKGYIESGYKLDVLKIKSFFMDRFFYFDIKDETLPAYNYDDFVNQPGLKGLFAAKMLTKINSTTCEKEKYLLKKALQYGIEALEDRL